MNGALFMAFLVLSIQAGLRLYGVHVEPEGWEAFGGNLLVSLGALISGAYLEAMLRKGRSED